VARTAARAVSSEPSRHALIFDWVPKKYGEVKQALKDAGWLVVRQRGSHEIWAKFGHKRRIVVAGKNSDTVPTGTLSSIRRASGLDHLR
jgi:predicted RNA binding protein YcfA (HicA-like mRNA interferase family)